MKRNRIAMAAAALVLALFLSGCGKTSPKSAPWITDAYKTPGTETTAPDIATAPIQTENTEKTRQPGVYIIDGTKIYRQYDGDNTLIYDAADHFDKSWNCWLNNLVEEDGVIYFAESGILGDDEENSVHRIIRIDEYGRKVLDEKNVTGYAQLVPYGNRIIFVQDGFDSQDIGWAYKDGSASAYLDFSEYAARYGVEYCNGATLRFEDGVLYADISFFVDADPEIEEHTVSISEELEITRVK